ncbi:hypothetical protein GGR34_003698 [Microvirga flocculans]|uniref:IraD/Gp25-like domain-containing protein n=1 Tax=Microvirga flocculans TaxID=217168 RepID=A0A7W6N996_9HYPH|nr:GPW/gp25 family protein [Microvirga flocculans]MBB4042013.1 hypothetical protein [Microvirga flocculans]
MAGMNRRTGRWLSGWDHLLQSLEVLFSTMVGTRVMRRSFGSVVPALLGRPINQSTVLRFATAVIVAVELWEPRFRIKQISFEKSRNSPEKLRLGQLTMSLVGEYRPRAHLGDPTPEGGERTINF